MESIKGILILSPFFSPNIGGVESHIDDTVKAYAQKYKVFILTYSPITTPLTKWKKRQFYQNVSIFRFPWFGHGLFHKLETYPLLNFIYLTPYLLLRSFIWMLFNQKKINYIHSHGLNAAIIGNTLSFIFHKKHINSTHAIYNYPASNIVSRLSAFVYNHCSVVLAQSNLSKKQLVSWGVDAKRISFYRHWIDLKIFKPAAKPPKKFTVLFVGRLIKKKGTRLFISLAKNIPQANFYMIGSGPDSEYLSTINLKNYKFIGQINNSQISHYYQQASIFCSPVIYKEGFSRTIMEAVGSGLPVVASNLGTIPEIVNDSVSILTKPNVDDLTIAIKKLIKDKKYFLKLRKNTRIYAQKYFSKNNLNLITKHFS